MTIRFAPLPIEDAIAVPVRTNPPNQLAAKLPKFRLGDAFTRYFSDQNARVEQTAERVDAFTPLVDQAASIATTPIPIQDVVKGVYRISVTVRVTRPGTVSSAIQVTLTWQERGITQTESTSNLNGNLTTTREGKTFVIRADADTPISYSTTYATAGATAMQYSLDIAAELLGADA